MAVRNNCRCSPLARVLCRGPLLMGDRVGGDDCCGWVGPTTTFLDSSTTYFVSTTYSSLAFPNFILRVDFFACRDSSFALFFYTLSVTFLFSLSTVAFSAYHADMSTSLLTSVWTFLYPSITSCSYTSQVTYSVSRSSGFRLTMVMVS